MKLCPRWKDKKRVSRFSQALWELAGHGHKHVLLTMVLQRCWNEDLKTKQKESPNKTGTLFFTPEQNLRADFVALVSSHYYLASCQAGPVCFSVISVFVRCLT